MEQSNNLNLDVSLTEKQNEAFILWDDNITEELLIGGGAGGGKSFLGCFMIILNCMRYPRTRWFLGRAEKLRLKQTTLKTFFYICRKYKLFQFFTLNWADSTIRWFNGSEIVLLDLAYQPRDPDYERLGGFELTGGFGDEAGEIDSKCRDILRSRCRFGLEETTIPKIVLSCNPSKNFLYADFYKPWKNNQLELYRGFVPFLHKDNPYLHESYKRTLNSIKDKLTRERLFFGNWEYDDDPSVLVEYNAIIDMFHAQVSKENDKKYITCDVARMGSDKTVIFVWKGLQVIHIYVYEKKKTNEIADILIKLALEYSIPRSHIIIDEAGVGGGVVDDIPDCQGFIGGSSAIGESNYGNLRAQCYFILAQNINEHKIGISDVGLSSQIKEELIADCEQIKQKDPDKDGKLYIIPKEKIKEILRRSPDWSDTLSMRMLPLAKPEKDTWTFMPL